MPSGIGSTSDRKKDHLQLTLSGEVSFRNKSNGFEYYDFIHHAVTEVNLAEITFETDFLGRKISFPFLISCMTGGTSEAENINLALAEAAEELQIPIGMGSQRQALENDTFHGSYKIIRKKAASVPILGNIGAAQVVKLPVKKVAYLRDLVNADAMVIHFNSLQELIQKEGDVVFTGVLKKTEELVKTLPVPVIAKEVGAGISQTAAESLLECGVKGIDTAGAGGTSWSGVELLRNKQTEENYFWDWGLPTSYCIRKNYELKSKYKFDLIGSGGINSDIEMAKAFALGADITASARIILMQYVNKGHQGVVDLIKDWFTTLKKIMYLTGSADLNEFRKNKITLKGNLI